MDVFAHGFWAAALAKIINFKKRKPVKVWLTAVWGVFPDVFAFAPLFAWMAFQAITGNFNSADFAPTGMEPTQTDTLPIFKLTHLLYNLTHSLLAFAIIFLLMFLIFRRARWSALGWLFHIIIDIPSHSYEFFPTPFLWPFSDWKFSGIAWANPWFLLFNYLMLGIVWLAIWWGGKKAK